MLTTTPGHLGDGGVDVGSQWTPLDYVVPQELSKCDDGDIVVGLNIATKSASVKDAYIVKVKFEGFRLLCRNLHESGNDATVKSCEENDVLCTTQSMASEAAKINYMGVVGVPLADMTNTNGKDTPCVLPVPIPADKEELQDIQLQVECLGVLLH